MTETLTPATAEDHAPLLERAFTLIPEERAYAIAGIEGEIPDYLRGSYYLMGPARFARGEVRYRHWLDGDGMVAALHFDRGGGVRFANRFVASAKHAAEEEAGRALFRAFGTSFEGDQLVRGIALASPVNVSVFRVGEALLAFGEQGLPWELDPDSLETRGEYTFGGRLNAISPFSAHPSFDFHSGEMFNFGISFAAQRPLLNFYRFDRSGAMTYRRRLPLPYPCSVHDFILGPRHAVFYLAPYLLDMEALARDGRTLMDSLSWEPERGSHLVVVERDSGAEAASIPIDGRYCLHLINCFEDGGRLAVDVVELDRPVYDQYQEVPDLFTDVGPGRPVRYLLDVESWELAGREEIDYPLAPDFPAIDLRQAAAPYEDLWILGISKTGQPGRKFFDQLAHLSWGTGEAAGVYQTEPGFYLGGEPVFVGDPERRRSGVVICPVFDAAREATEFLLFDAFAVARGPIARLPLEVPIHLGFHASFDHR